MCWCWLIKFILRIVLVHDIEITVEHLPSIILVIIYGACSNFEVPRTSCAAVDILIRARTFFKHISYFSGKIKANPMVLCGPSGCGKSTLLKQLMADYPSLFGFSVSRKS